MKIVCITLHYQEKWGYQDNLLAEYMARMGHQVTVISDWYHTKYDGDEEFLPKIGSEKKYNVDGVDIIRLNSTYLNSSNTCLFCRGFYKIIEAEKPEMIFHHGVNNSTLMAAALYKKRHPKIILYADNHADFINQSKNKTWLLFYNSIIKISNKWIAKYVDKYFGVTWLRCDYLHTVFGIDKKQIEYLPIGGDTDKVDSITETQKELRLKLGIPVDSFVIATGGKMDRSKGTISLVDAYEQMISEGKHVCLITFGKYDEEIISSIKDKKNIFRFGWCNRIMTLSILKSADVAVWPLLHTTLIEDAISCGIPIIVKESGNVKAYVSEKSGIFLKKGDSVEIFKALSLMIDKNKYRVYKSNAMRIKDKYSYRTIVKSIADCKSLYHYELNNICHIKKN